MMRPLLVTDCDEVLLNMIGHFAAWAEEGHGLHFCLDEADWPDSLLVRPGGEPVGAARARELLHAFLETEMDRQDPVPGAVEALGALSEAPSAWRLHMIAEPRVARHVPPAPESHARIDRWDEALPWILERLRQG